MDEHSEQPKRERSARTPRSDYEDSPRDIRHTESPPKADDDWQEREPVDPNWRRERISPKSDRQRGRARASSSPQEFQLWLQAGGWRYIAIIAVLFIIVLVVLLWFNRTSRNVADTPNATSVSEPAAIPSIISSQPTVTAAAPTAAPVEPQFFIVVNTGGQGLFMRADHSTGSAQIDTLPDGTRVEQIGEDFVGPNFVWRHIRAPNGKEGWVAVDWLQPAQ